MDGEFLHRFIRRIGKRNAMAFEHILRIGNFAAAGIDFGIIRIRAALIADGLQALGPVSYTHLTLPTNREV